MEKIQQAIAKAREMRDAQQHPASPEAAAASLQPAHDPASIPNASPPPEPAAPATPVAPAAPEPVDRERIWQAIPETKVSPRRLRRGRILTGQGGKDSAEFDMIRTRILQAQRANGWRRIAITSPEPGSGKSTLAMNLAFSLARQPEHHTILAEVDLRRPSIAKTLGLRQGSNFAGVLRGTDAFEDNCVRIGPNLIFATCAAPSRNSAELLQSDTASQAIAAIEARFQPSIMLFDLPPMLVGDDAMAFLPRVDATVLVAAAEKTTIKQIDICEREIASQTNVLGVVLNKCRYMDRDRSYGYEYY